MKPKGKYIHDPIFSTDYYVQRGGALQSAADKFAKLIGMRTWEESQHPRVRGRFIVYEDHKAGCIWIQEKCGTGIVAHEATHAANRIARDLCMRDLDQSDEFIAYYTAWLCREIVKGLF